MWISTNYFKGHGKISVRGGLGNTYGSALGGSGAGGRIAVFMNKEDEFRGSYSPFGGPGHGPRQGGPGTVYVEEMRQSHIYNRLYIDNRNANPVKEFVLSERNPREAYHKRADGVETEYHIDELMVINQVGCSFLELVDIECALGHVTWSVFATIINPPYWIYLYCSKRIIE